MRTGLGRLRYFGGKSLPVPLVRVATGDDVYPHGMLAFV